MFTKQNGFLLNRVHSAIVNTAIEDFQHNCNLLLPPALERGRCPLLESLDGVSCAAPSLELFAPPIQKENAIP